MALIVSDDKIRCEDCGRWVYVTQADNIRHSSRCDTPDIQPTQVERPWYTRSVVPQPKYEAAILKAAARRGDLANYATDDEVFEAVRAGLITESEAMNQDL